MKTKYDWRSVPKWVNWIFVDQDGDKFGCDNKPCNLDGFHGNPSEDTWEYLEQGCSTDDWRESLEERPNEN